MSKNYEILNELIPKTQELHRDIFDKGYEQGQRDALCEISTEIGRMYRVTLKGTPKDDWAVRWNDCLDDVLQTIGKYRGESEDKK